MNQIDLNGQVAVITGGAQGLGFAMAKRTLIPAPRPAFGTATRKRWQKRSMRWAPGRRARWSISSISTSAIDANAWVEAEVDGVSILVNSAGWPAIMPALNTMTPRNGAARGRDKSQQARFTSTRSSSRR